LITALMDLTQLRTFVAVAEEQHLTRGAERIYLSLSAASAHVRALEDTYGVKLFHRTNRALELTDTGRCLLEHAKSLLRQAAEFESQARLHAGVVAGTITFGCNADPALGRVGEIVEILSRTCPALKVRMLRRTAAAARQGLQSGELDVGMYIGYPSDADITHHALRLINYRIAGPAKWSSVIEAGDWEALARLPWIEIVSNAVYAQMLDEAFQSRGLVRTSVNSTDSDVFLRTLITAGVGLSVIREEHAKDARQAGLMAIAPDWEAQCPLQLAYPKARAHDPLIHAFVKAARSVWKDAEGLSDSLRS
jgi:DNA-binding transcriptional LysR family regulator